MKFLADLHLHSHFSNGVSETMTLDNILAWAKKKGLKLIGTGDCLCIKWLDEITGELDFSPDLSLFSPKGCPSGPRLMLTTEVNLRFFKDRVYQIHFLITFKDTKDIIELILILERKGFGKELLEEGRPTLELQPEEFLEILSQFSDSLVIPSHYLTPWFGLLGARGLSKDCLFLLNIHALETGLSSVPEMGRRIKELDPFPLVSFSDAHSLQAIGREATAFNCELSYHQVCESIRKGSFPFTIEYPPEKGKYFWGGHRFCEKSGPFPENCPLCNKPYTEGVLSRVEKLSTRQKPIRKPLTVYHLPLTQLLRHCGYKEVSFEIPEFEIMLKFKEEELNELLPPEVVDLVLSLREKTIKIKPGYDGKFGEILN